MRILVLGGTRFIGRAVVDQAVSRGHDVSTFTRGRHGEPRPGAEALHGDRTRHEDLRVLATRDWDAVIDTSVIAPAHVAASARLLADRAGHYAYVSSLSVYAWPREPVTEQSVTHDCPPEAEGSVESLGYGPLKAGCEQAVAAAFPGRHLIVRPGLIAGPHDDVGRLPWWLARVARGGQVLAPGHPGRPVRLTDARDLAGDAGQRPPRDHRDRNVPGPRGCTFGDLMDACVGAACADSGVAAELVWAPDDVLLAAGVQPYTELPMWAPDIPELAGTWEASGERARLACRVPPVGRHRPGHLGLAGP